MMIKLRYLFIFLIGSTLLIACNNTKHLAANQSLYIGSDIKIVDSSKKANTKELKEELNALLRPAPNKKILGGRFKLTMYNLMGKSEKGIAGWIKRKIGEPPVLTSMSALEKNRAVLQNRLENRGYFSDTVMFDTTTKNKKTQGHYTAYVGEQYKLRNITFPVDSSELGKEIHRAVTPVRRSLLKKDDPYDLDVIKDERDRIDNRLKNRGFYYFSPDYLLANADSAVGNHKVDINMTVKRRTPDQAKHIYHIKEVVVFADYDINTDTSLSQPGVEKYGGYTIVDPEKKFKPKVFSRALIFDTGAIYRRDDHNLSLNRLVTLGTFKFVKARFVPTDTAHGEYWLNAFYYLTPTEKKSIRFEASALTKSNNSNGGELSLSWRHRNLLKGAELFTLSIYGGMEKQVIANQPDVNIFRYGGDASITVPRIIAPFKFQTNSGFMPKTKATIGYELYSRTDQYTLNSARATFGYIWKESLQKEHQLTVFNFNFVRPSNITDSFQRQLDTNIVLARSIEKQFIIGSIYNFNYNSQLKQNNRRNNFYFNGNIDLSGNIPGIISGANVEAGKQKTIVGVPYSQYIRLEAEFRHYYKINKNTVLASRALAGLGYAYDNSQSMPFVKAFFAGGTNDLRGFVSRSLGPGNYYAGNPAAVGYLGDQPGDMKLEFNTELRGKLFSVVKGALFIDAGNTWLVREDSLRPGGKFSSSFLSQMAVNTGVGLRFDFSILVLRVDLGMPIRKPLPGGGGFQWFYDWKESWRRENWMLNLAIGYPF
ncbi:MAG: BamA/TamA family outer membrane protein [Filimonas sp.]|nr:BamA/TamA family outer membrane protein [Filimonas sp.]